MLSEIARPCLSGPMVATATVSTLCSVVQAMVVLASVLAVLLVSAASTGAAEPQGEDVTRRCPPQK